MFDYINNYYGLSLKRGTQCEFMGRCGKVTGVRGAYVLVKLESDEKLIVCHPTWEMEYDKESSHITTP
jgi:ribosomal protein L21E